MNFVCHVGTADGRVLRQVRAAPSESALRTELEREGFQLIGFERGRLGGAPQPGRWRSRARRIPLTDVLIFTQELGALLRAGLPLLQSVRMLLERQRNPVFKSVLEQVHDRVKNGAELSEAFLDYADMFPPLLPAAIKAGERTGDLEKVLDRLVRYLRLVLDARKRVYSALVYPTVLLCLSVGLLAIMALYVVPRFRIFYQAMDIAQLPMLTRITLGVTTTLRANLLPIVAGLLLAYFALRQWANTPKGRILVSRLRLRIPILGGVFHRFGISEYCRSLSTLLSGGLPLVQALEIATRAVGNAWLSERLLPAIGRVREGQSLHDALAKTGEMPPIALDMVEVGETTGSLDQMLVSVSGFLDEEVETRMQRLLSLIEPLLLLGVGGMVAILLLSVYLPMFSALGKIQ